MLSKFRMYENNIIKIISRCKTTLNYNYLEKLLARNQKDNFSEIVHFLDRFVVNKYNILNRVYIRPIELWIYCTGNYGKVNTYGYNIYSCLKCGKYVAKTLYEGGFVCPRKGCDGVYSADCECRRVQKSELMIHEIDKYYRCRREMLENEPEESDMFIAPHKKSPELVIDCLSCRNPVVIRAEWGY